MQLQEILFSQGFGTRRICSGLVQQGFVLVDGEACSDPSQQFDPHGLHFTVQGGAWQYHEKAYLMLHKPSGYECSQKPSTYPSIYTLLLLSDDGKFIHRMSSPKHHVAKVYDVTAKHAVDDQQVQKLLAGVVLDDDPKPVRAAACELSSELQLSLTLTEGKYHQVKRMIAAVGNRVEGLHRSRIGSLDLPVDLKPGEWRWLTENDLANISAAPQTKI